jgi:hypothetical protein
MDENGHWHQYSQNLSFQQLLPVAAAQKEETVQAQSYILI